MTVVPARSSEYRTGRWRKVAVITSFILPALFVYVVYVMYPIVDTLIDSFFAWDGQSTMTFIGFKNYVHLLRDSIFWTALKNNVLVILASVCVQIPLGMVMALILLSPIRGRRIFGTVYFFPFLMSTVAIGLLWTYIFDPLNGPLNHLIRTVGIQNWQIQWLSDPRIAVYAVLLVVVWQYAPFYMILFKAAMVAIPEELYEAASLDGATAWQKFWRITVPLIMPTIVSSAILAIVGSLKSFDLFYIMTGGGPDHATELLGTYMYKAAFVDFNMGYASSIAFSMFLVAFIVTVVIQYLEFVRQRRGG